MMQRTAELKKITVYILDINEETSEEDIARTIDHAFRHCNAIFCFSRLVEKKIPWSDKHPLNQGLNLTAADVEKYFKEGNDEEESKRSRN